MKSLKVVIFGCGNVAGYFAEKFVQNNHHIIQVFHPELTKAHKFAFHFKSLGINDITQVNTHADLYFIAVKDDAIAEIANQLPACEGMVLHTSGSIELNVLSKHNKSAVFYPLQTFTKGINMANQNFPLLIECMDKKDQVFLEEIAKQFGLSAHYMSSQQRTEIHLAAVFAANFSNHCIKIAYDLMKSHGHESNLLFPLIKESIHKLNFISPSQAQTGPAIRKDEVTIEKHLNMLNNDTNLKLIYELMSKHIQLNPTNP